MTPYLAGFMSKCAELGVGRGPALRLFAMGKSAGFASDHAADLLGAALGAGTGYLLTGRDDDGRKKGSWVLNSLVGAAAGGLGAGALRRYLGGKSLESVYSSSDVSSGELSENAPDIASYVRGANSDKVRKALGIPDGVPVTHHDVATYFSKTHPGILPVEVSPASSIPRRGAGGGDAFDMSSTANREVYEYRLAQTIDLVDTLRGMGFDEKAVSRAAGAFADATSKRTFDWNLRSGMSRTGLRLSQVKPEIDRSKGEILSKMIYGG